MCQRGQGNFTFTLERYDVTVTIDSIGMQRKKRIKISLYTHKTKKMKGRKSNQTK